MTNTKYHPSLSLTLTLNIYLDSIESDHDDDEDDDEVSIDLGHSSKSGTASQPAGSAPGGVNQQQQQQEQFLAALMTAAGQQQQQQPQQQQQQPLGTQNVMASNAMLIAASNAPDAMAMATAAQAIGVKGAFIILLL